MSIEADVLQPAPQAMETYHYKQNENISYCQLDDLRFFLEELNIQMTIFQK